MFAEIQRALLECLDLLDPSPYANRENRELFINAAGSYDLNSVIPDKDGMTAKVFLEKQKDIIRSCANQLMAYNYLSEKDYKMLSDIMDNYFIRFQIHPNKQISNAADNHNQKEIVGAIWDLYESVDNFRKKNYPEKEVKKLKK